MNNIVYPNPTPPGVKLEKNVHATMRDGVKISVDIYKSSQGKGPWPVIPDAPEIAPVKPPLRDAVRGSPRFTRPK
jgi:predicted acyl esterase